MSENKQTEQGEEISQPKKKGLKNLNKKQKSRLIGGVSVLLATGIITSWGLSNTSKDTNTYTKKDVQEVEKNVKAYDKGLDVKLDDETKKLMEAEKIDAKEGTKEGQNTQNAVPLSPASTKAKMLVSKVPVDNGEAMKSTADALEKLMDEVIPNMQSEQIRDTAKKVPEMKEVQLTGMSILQEYQGMADELRLTAEKLEHGTDGEKQRVPEALESVKKRADKLKMFEADYTEAKEKAKHVKVG